jgi:hypothetical protein
MATFSLCSKVESIGQTIIDRHDKEKALPLASLEIRWHTKQASQNA